MKKSNKTRPNKKPDEVPNHKPAKFDNIGLLVPEILLPNSKIDVTKWSVVACDQYTSQPEYWNNAAKIVGPSPSTLKIIFPEIFLEEKGKEKRISSIQSEMKKYLKDKTLASQGQCLIFVDRKTSHTNSRKGLIVALDLEKYDYNKGSQTLIRATESTVLERLPPRIKIRENACIESPHIMVLIDDPKKNVIEPLSSLSQKGKLQKLYDFDLMLDGGHIKGFKVDDPRLIESIASALEKLADRKAFNSKYGLKESAAKNAGILLFAVGDGNHSLATAKAIWKEKKKKLIPEEFETDPARYALVELVNVHDFGLVFEPIHRVVFDIDIEDALENITEYFKRNGSDILVKSLPDTKSVKSAIRKTKNIQVVGFVHEKGFGIISIKNPKSNLEVGTLQGFLDEYLRTAKSPKSAGAKAAPKIDYIHGDDIVEELGKKPGNIGFFLPAMEKTDLFKTVILDGVLPRKTFSMGEAEEKRYYLECRKIIK